MKMSIQANESDNDHVELEIKSLLFYSRPDEDSLFARLKKIKSIRNIHGVANCIIVKVSTSAIDDDDLAELISVFKRYGIEMKQLSAFDDGRFPWLKDQNMFWYKDIFE